MTEPADNVVRWLAAARDGSNEALGQLLEVYQGYLLMVARRELATELQAKGGASDLVQETFLDAQRGFAQFQGTTEAELRAWLRRLLLNNLSNFTRRFRGTAKRQTATERALEAGSSSRDWTEGLIADSSSPSELAMAHERAQAVQQALTRLPEDYRRVILLRNVDGLSHEEVAERMERGAGAVRMLWVRALARLRDELGDNAASV